MACDICLQAGRDHNKIKQAILRSPLDTGIYICGFDWLKNSLLHYALDKWFVESLDAGHRRFLAMIPRAHMKTTYFAISYMINLILNDPEVRILYRMASATEAQKTLNSIVNIMSTSEALKHFFPKSVLVQTDEGVVCRADMLRVKRKGIYREGTIEARGRDSLVTGGHFTHQLCDDLIDETAVDSEKSQNTAVGRIRRSDSMFVNPASDIELIIGTRWPGMFYRWLLEDSGISDEYRSVILGCYVDDRFNDFMAEAGVEHSLPIGSPVWPEHYTVDALQKIQRKSPYDFVHQWENLEVEEGSRRFNREDFIVYTIDEDMNCRTMVNGQPYTINAANLFISMTIDPATGENERTDQSAITVCGFDRSTGFIFVLDVWQGRVLPGDLIDKIITMALKWHPNVVSPEDVSFQKTLKHFLRQEMIQRDVRFPIKPAKPGAQRKGARILDALQPFSANHQIRVLRSHFSTLVNELVSLQVVAGKVVGRSPNLADSLSYHAEFWKGRAKNIAVEDATQERVNLWLPGGGPAYGIECLT